MTFFTLSTIFYAALVAWVSSRVAGTTAEWGYTLAHMTLAAAINAHLLWVARRRELLVPRVRPLSPSWWCITSTLRSPVSNISLRSFSIRNST